MSFEYISIRNRSTSVLVEKKSRFIADAKNVCSEDEARAFLTEIKGMYPEASHHTYAYVIGRQVPAARYSDDGEPHGTAGLPILDVLKNKEITDTIIVVTRYFGGTKLGAGGLVRAYSKSAAECMEAADIVRHIPGEILEVKTDYHFLGKIKNFFERAEYGIMDEDYSGHVIMKVLVPVKESDSVKQKLMDLTNAAATVKSVREEYIEAED